MIVSGALLSSETTVTQSTPGLCKEPKICRSDGQSYTCSCPDGFAGDDCRNVVNIPCNDLACRRDKPMTFSGSSYIRWRPTVPMEKRLNLRLELRTVQRRARLMHAVGRVDYSILELEDGFVQYRFDCGSGPGSVRVDSVAVNDGYWHTVSVERISKNVRIVVDDTYFADGSGPGTNDVLNLDSNDVFFGAQVDVLSHGFEHIEQGFIGCLQKIRIDLVDLPLHGSSSVGILQNLHDVEFHCQGIYIPGVCSSSPCQNGGICVPFSADRYTCRCRDRFIGDNCEIDTNPCASNPCLNDGVCQNLPNTYNCVCRGHTKGARCELREFCDSAPCQHGSHCSEGVTGPVCECPSGYTGELCEVDVNECASDPCPSESICFNFDGGYACNCSDPAMCPSLYTNVESSPLGVSWEELVAIVAVVLLLVLVGVMVVFFLRCRRRRKRRLARQQTAGASDEDFHPYIVDDAATHKLSCADHTRESGLCQASCISDNSVSPHQPTSPNRPASYMLSTSDSVMPGQEASAENMMRARDYGSNADDLQNVGRQPDGSHSPEFVGRSPAVMSKRFIPPVLADNGEASKGLNNLNKAENYRKKNPEKIQKLMPAPANQSLQSLQLLQSGPDGASVSSLPISESEDDTQGYHWDTSDWNPAAQPLLPRYTGDVHLPPSPTSSHHSTDLNVDLDPSGYGYLTDDFDPGNDSEYVGDDSEFADNDDDDDDVGGPSDVDEPNADYPPAASASLNFGQVLAMRDQLNYGTDEWTDSSGRRPRRRRHRGPASAAYSVDPVHPNDYLPRYNISLSGSTDQSLADDAVDGANINDNFNSADFICREGDDDVIHYGFPPSASLLRPRDRHDRSAVDDDDDAMDSISMSLPGTASELDLSGVCEIEDSEANASDIDDAIAELRPLDAPSAH